MELAGLLINFLVACGTIGLAVFAFQSIKRENVDRKFREKKALYEIRLKKIQKFSHQKENLVLRPFIAGEHYLPQDLIKTLEEAKHLFANKEKDINHYIDKLNAIEKKKNDIKDDVLKKIRSDKDLIIELEKEITF